LAILRAHGHGVREIARRLARAPSTISRELRRNAATRSGGFDYRATTAQWHADRAARRPKLGRLAVNAALRTYVQERLAGVVVAPGGAAAHGPVVPPWKGRRHGRRQDRRWAKAWSPEQIAYRLRLDFPDDTTMRISHEATYQALYVQGRGALRRELTACLRTGRALRVPRARTRGPGKSFIAPEIMISDRPAIVESRSRIGDWEADTLLGALSDSHCLLSLVERRTGYLELGKLHARTTAEVNRRAIPLIRRQPHPVHTITSDNGTEFHGHVALEAATQAAFYFATPHHAWERGTNENTNGLVRQYLPKRVSMAHLTQQGCEAIARQLNQRPRKRLGYRTPEECYAR
jgi:IS30 family transposase